MSKQYLFFYRLDIVLFLLSLMLTAATAGVTTNFLAEFVFEVIIHLNWCLMF